MAGGGLRVSRSCAIPPDELEWRFNASGGPGGQHANTSNTRVELRFDIASSRALGPLQRSRLMDKVGPTLRVVVDDERSQARNRQLALERLAKRLADGLRRPKERKPTRPSQAARARRMGDKRRRAEVKRLRKAEDHE